MILYTKLTVYMKTLAKKTTNLLTKLTTWLKRIWSKLSNYFSFKKTVPSHHTTHGSNSTRRAQSTDQPISNLSTQSIQSIVRKNQTYINEAAKQITCPYQIDPSLTDNLLATEGWRDHKHPFKEPILRLSTIKTELSKREIDISFAANIRSHQTIGIDWLASPHYRGRLFKLSDLNQRHYDQARKSAVLKKNFFQLFKILLLLHDYPTSSKPYLTRCQTVRIEKFFWTAFLFYRLQDDFEYRHYMASVALPFLKAYQEALYPDDNTRSNYLGSSDHNIDRKTFPSNAKPTTLKAFIQSIATQQPSPKTNVL